MNNFKITNEINTLKLKVFRLENPPKYKKDECVFVKIIEYSEPTGKEENKLLPTKIASFKEIEINKDKDNIRFKNIYYVWYEDKIVEMAEHEIYSKEDLEGKHMLI